VELANHSDVRMSEMSHSRRASTSGLPLSADMFSAGRHVSKVPGTDMLPVVGIDLTAFERSHSRAIRNRSLIGVAGSAPGTNDLAFLGRFRHAVIVPHS
jgi:hypothetical protein